MPIDGWLDGPLSGTLCPACRSELPFGILVCVRCGARLAPLAVARESVIEGTPIVEYAASAAGPRVTSEARPGRGTIPDLGPQSSRPQLQRFEFYPDHLAAPPAPSARPQRGHGRVWVLVVPLLVVALGIGALLLHGTPNLSASISGAPAASTPAQSHPSAGENACALAAGMPASTSIGEIHLATALVDKRAGDYRPQQTTTVVRTGETVYLTFRVATADDGDVGVRLCMRNGQYAGDVAVPAGSQGRYVAFSTAFGPEDRGPGLALVTWNAMPVAVLRFTVVQ